LPFLVLGMFLAQRDGAGWVAEWVLADVFYGIAVGVGMGAAGGWLLAAVIVPLRARRVLRTDFDGWLGIASVLVIYGATDLVSAYGFLAAFVGGLAFRRFRRNSSIHDGVHDGAETAGRVSELAVLLLLGSLVTLTGLGEPGLAGWAICLALLFVIRPATVFVAFVRSRLVLRERVFLAWFGVRGIGSLNYVAVVLASGVLTREAESTIFWTVAVAMLLSITLHGMTGTMLTERLLHPPRPDAAAARTVPAARDGGP
jgi:sodium/hydrogen antiporter